MILEAFETFVNAMKGALKPMSRMAQNNQPLNISVATAAGGLTRMGAANSNNFSEAATAKPLTFLQATAYTLGKQGVSQSIFSKKPDSLLGNSLPTKILSLAADALNALRVQYGVLPKDWKQKPFEVEPRELRPEAANFKPTFIRGPG